MNFLSKNNNGSITMYLLLKKKRICIGSDSNENHCPMNTLSQVDLCLPARHLYYGQLFSKSSL